MVLPRICLIIMFSVFRVNDTTNALVLVQFGNKMLFLPFQVANSVLFNCPDRIFRKPAALEFFFRRSIVIRCCHAYYTCLVQPLFSHP
ncbi:MAG TPA: hypothetical protein DDW24_06445 [Blastocatellia bacterium]|nr:hypothetical protein [Blastocatellia bacterium]